MNNYNNNVELLSPAGSIESVYAAVKGGCNAVYIGGKDFSARQYASNFSDEEIEGIIDYCHIRNVKVFIALNILYKDSEIKSVLKFVSKAYSYGVDAFIIQDIGIFNLINKNFPDVDIHASTQMTIHNLEQVKFLKQLGFKRVILSRELSLDEIKYITKNCAIEIETFVHGALCVCYSGRCLMSSIIGERSGNRGRCAQPCRMRYSLLKDNKIIKKDSYLISPKDIMTLQIIDKLIKAGIHTLKIEGRMKSPEYVYKVTSLYRKYIDEVKNNNFKLETSDIKQITQIFNRGGSFSTGYYTNWAGKNMISPSPKSSGLEIGKVTNYSNGKCSIYLTEDINCGDGIEIWTSTEPHVGTNISKSSQSGNKITISIKGNIQKGDIVYKSYDKKLDNEINFELKNESIQQKINAEVIAHIKKPLYIKLSYNNISVEHFGDIVSEANNQPLTKEKLLLQLSKTGNTPFKIDFKNCNIDNNIYISISSINNLRREAISKLEKEIIKSYKRKEINTNIVTCNDKEQTNEKFITVSVQNKDQFDEAISYGIKRIYIELSNLNKTNIEYYIKKAHLKNIEVFTSFYRIYRQDSKKTFDEMIEYLEKTDIDGYLIRDYIKLKTSKKVIYDYTFNVFNKFSRDFLFQYADTITLSPELNIKQLDNIASENTEIYIYGKIPLMTTHQCPVGLYDGNKTCGKYCNTRNNTSNYLLKDRKNALFPIITDCLNCFALILNCHPIFVLNKFNSIKELNSKYFRLSFTNESKELTGDIIYSYLRLLNGKSEDERINNLIKSVKENGYTNGHFFRDVL